jgi:hypothetical protein
MPRGLSTAPRLLGLLVARRAAAHLDIILLVGQVAEA